MTASANWTPARIYNVYRISIATMLLALHLVPEKPIVGNYAADLFIVTVMTYLVITLLYAALEYAAALPRPGWLQPLPLMTDLLVLTLVVHSNGGLEGGLAVLLLVTVAAGNILLRGRLGYLIAALATLAVMYEQFYFSISAQEATPFKLTESGLLGIAFFMVSLIIQQIAQRLDRSESIARRQRVAIKRLEALNEQIIQRMRTGVMVFNSDMQILQANQAADSMFATPMRGRHLPQHLIEAHQRWRENASMPQTSFKASPQSPNLTPRFAPLETGDEELTIAFLEDTARIAQEAQHMNLASLGRLSATLAHEIRNPLSAIHQATDLLADDTRSPEDKRLLEIIHNHVMRVNCIIHDVLDLSRRPRGQAALFALNDFADEVRADWIGRGKEEEQVRIKGQADVQVRFDRNQLHQVLSNLIDNAFHHGGQHCQVVLDYGYHPQTGLPWLSITDNGRGISAEQAQHLFEPFYTNSETGNGLGLYVCRELCHANQATLDHEATETGARFVITFAHPNRQFQ